MEVRCSYLIHLMWIRSDEVIIGKEEEIDITLHHKKARNSINIIIYIHTHTQQHHQIPCV